MNYDPRGWGVHKDSKHSFDEAAPYIDNGTDRPDPARYIDPEFAKAEWEKVFTKTWLLAGPSSDAREPDDWFKFDIGVESFIIIRQEDGTLAAHYNVCPHRGSRLVLGDFGCQSTFSCPFHSWKFAADGHNVAVTDAETFRPEVLCHDTNLTSVRVEEEAGLIFIAMSDDVPSLAEYLGPVLPMLKTYEIDKMHVVQHRRSDWAANWKGGMDAFYENYHLHAIHPQTMGMLDDRTHIDLFDNGMSRQFVPFGQPNSHFPDQEGINPGIAAMLKDAGLDPEKFEGTAAESRSAIAFAKRERAKQFGLDYDKFSDAQLTDATAIGIFPNSQIGCHVESVFFHRFKPNGSDPHQFTYDTMIMYRHIDAPGYNAPLWMGIGDDVDMTGATRPDTVHTGLGEPPGMGEVLDQDSDLLPIVHAGARSRGFRGPLWSEQEARVRHFHVTLDKWLGNEPKG